MGDKEAPLTHATVASAHAPAVSFEVFLDLQVSETW
jgi:hypothetical protein